MIGLLSNTALNKTQYTPMIQMHQQKKMRRQLPCSLLTDSSAKHLSEELDDVRALKMMSELKFELSLIYSKTC